MALLDSAPNMSKITFTRETVLLFGKMNVMVMDVIVKMIFCVV